MKLREKLINLQVLQDILSSAALVIILFTLVSSLGNIGRSLSIFIYYLAIIISAWKMGLRGSMVTTFFVIITAIGSMVFIDHHLVPNLALPIIIFTFEGLLIGLMAERFQQQVMESKRNEERKDNFINMASHELKTPLSSMKIFAQMRARELEKSDDKKGVEYNTKMITQINRLTTLINSMLDITRIGAKRLELNKTECNLSDLIARSLIELQPILGKRTVSYASCSAPCFIDQDRIEQVLTNLLSNAVKYSPETTPINISCQVGVKYITVGIQDFGNGIPREEGDKIFDRFYRSHNAEKDYPGLGLGLFISNEIIKAHGGKMWYESQEGKGSTFYFRLVVHENDTRHRR